MVLSSHGAGLVCDSRGQDGLMVWSVHSGRVGTGIPSSAIYKYLLWEGTLSTWCTARIYEDCAVSLSTILCEPYTFTIGNTSPYVFIANPDAIIFVILVAS